jgi:CO/xanthine dehydrogenase Mo-binding subunit
MAEAGRLLYPGGRHSFELTARFTNQIPGGGFRGYGATQGLLAVEQAVDEAARRVGLSPFEIRRRNAMRHAKVGSGQDGFSRLRDVLDLAEETWSRRRPGPPLPGWIRGWGLAACALLSTTVVPVPEATATVLRLHEDGTVTMATGSCDCGTGSSHALATLAADVLGLDREQVAVLEGDSDLGVMNLGSFGQRTVYIAGTSVERAARALRGRVLDAAASRLGRSPGELDLTSAGIVDGTGQMLMGLADLAGAEAIEGRAMIALDETSPPEAGTGAEEETPIPRRARWRFVTR